MLADDHQAMRQAVRRLLEREFDVVAELDDGHSVLDVVGDLEPDVLVLDVSMPRLSGMEAARRLRRAGCRARVVFLTMHADADFARDGLATGALGYVAKTHMATDLVLAIHHALDGQPFVSPAIGMNEIPSPFAPPEL
jgi:DNA-binding NarL/FixJ family response regulator